MNNYFGFTKTAFFTMFLGLGTYYALMAIEENQLLALVATTIVLIVTAWTDRKFNVTQLLISSIVLAGMITANLVNVRDVFNVMAGTSWFLESAHMSSIVGYAAIIGAIALLAKHGAFVGFSKVYSSITMAATYFTSIFFFGEQYMLLGAAIMFATIVHSSRSMQLRSVQTDRSAAA